MKQEDVEKLERARSELRRLGYLDHRLERFLLQDALRPSRPLRTLALLTAKVGLLAGGILAPPLVLGLGVANGSLAATPLDLPLLFLHLFPPISAAAALVFLALSGLLLLALRLYPVRRLESVALAAAVAAGAAGLGAALWQGRGLVEPAAPGWLLHVAVLGLAVAGAVYLLTKLVYHGLLALAIRFTNLAPGGALLSRRWLSGAVLAAVLLLALPLLLAARVGEPPPPPALPVAPGGRVVLLGVDGVLPQEIDYLLAVGDLPAMGRLLKAGGRLLAYARRAEPPASFWTTVATGLPGPRHGVTALDSFVPLGVKTPLARSGVLRAYWSGVAVPLGLAEYRPLLANRRSAFTFWELASRGGAPVLSINWWATFPATELPGLVLAHDGFELLRQRVAGAVAPAAEGPALLPLAERCAAAAPDPRLAAALPAGAVAAVAERALRPDRFYREVFAGRLGAAPRAAALYLPGLDIAAAGWSGGGGVAFSDLVRSELAAADRLVGEAAAGPGLGAIAVVLDPGRRTERQSPLFGTPVPQLPQLPQRGGRLLLWLPQGCEASPAGPPGSITPEAIASGLLRALGLPQSAELPPPPAQCRWPAPLVTVPGYGRPQARRASGAEGAEYLRNLHSLGYL
ncbi:MAG TPA: hypothetical protein VHR45_18955 [Thermoanaerobaculia bacterium]|nr:hypothetical protein [Thermoanaerobaculia bacterium]